MNPRKIKTEVKEIIQFGEKVRLYKLKCLQNTYNFKPGQFLQLCIDEVDPSLPWPDSRAFSMANSPLNKNYVELLISEKGTFTKLIFNQISTGDNVWIKLPYGSFNFDDAINKEVVLIAGGTGISPFKSFLEFILDTKQQYNVTLFYGVANPDLIIIDELLIHASNQLEKFTLKLFIENSFSEYHKFPFQTGIISVNEILQTTTELNNPIYYLSGPQGMINSVSKNLLEKGISGNKIFYDKWE